MPITDLPWLIPALRIGIPVLATVIVALYLRRLDQRWRMRSEAMDTTKPVSVHTDEDVYCALKRGAEPAWRKSPLPCFQQFRLPGGNLRDECLECKVFRRAAAPAMGIR